MTLGLLAKIVQAAITVFAPGAPAEAAKLPDLVKTFLGHIKADLPPVTHEDGTLIPVEELDLMVIRKVADAHAAVHLGDRPAVDPAGPGAPGSGT